MINYRVADLEKLVAQLRKDGISITDEIESVEYGKFVHIMDLEGNKVELYLTMSNTKSSVSKWVR